jgi:hypothetical protein
VNMILKHYQFEDQNPNGLVGPFTVYLQRGELQSLKQMPQLTLNQHVDRALALYISHPRATRTVTPEPPVKIKVCIRKSSRDALWAMTGTVQGHVEKAIRQYLKEVLDTA